MGGIVNSSEYHAFATFTYAGTTYNVGTQTELRGSSTWYDRVIASAPQLGMTFGDELSVTQAQNVDLALADGAGGTYRTLAANNVIDGMQVAVTLVNRQRWSDGTTTELTYSQQLTVIGKTLEPSLVTLHLQDIEEQKLQALYPPGTWQSADWPELSSDDAGKPICEPIGTALKFPGVLVRGTPVENAYYYGLCTGTPKTFPINNLQTVTKVFVVTGDATTMLTVGTTFLVTGSTANDGLYTVTALSYSSPSTIITVAETIPNSTINGNIWVMPAALTVYRNKRIVGVAEYTQQILYTPLTVVNGSFASGFANWTTFYYTTAGGYVTTNPGTGCSLTTSAAGATITSVSSANAAFLMKSVAADGGTARPGGLYAVQVTVAAGGADATIFEYSALVAQSFRHVLPAGRTTTAILTSIAGAPVFGIGVSNDAGTTTVTGVRCIPFNLRLLKFAVPQIDFNGSAYAIEADLLGVESRNASNEIKRLLTNAGATADATSFAAAAASGFAQFVDCDYGRSGQRRLDAILNDLLPIARGALSRNAAGAYTIWQDKAGSPILTLDESVSDPVNISKFEFSAQPASVAHSYAPSSADPGQMQVNPRTRNVTGGSLGADAPREIRYLRDGQTADQLLCYRALRRWRNGTAVATFYGVQLNGGDIVSLTSPRNWPGQKSFTVWNVRRVKSGNEVSLREYDPAVYVYTAATLPPAAPTGYQPDYSFTPPAAPTALKLTATTARVDADGKVLSYAIVQAVPPSVNWQQIWFAAIHSVTGEIALGPGGALGGGVYGCSVGPLRPGEVYRLQTWAVNANSVQGLVQATFDATAIGGGAAATTFTAAGQTNLPANVTTITANQAMGSNVIVQWSPVTAKNIASYTLERSQNGGAWTVMQTALTTKYLDTNLIYGVPYQYRVRAQDNTGNFSPAYATTGIIAATANIYGGSSGNDIAPQTVATANRTNTTTLSASWSTSTASGVVFTHSLGRVAVCGAICSGNSSAILAPWSSDIGAILAVIFLDWSGVLTQTNLTSVSGTPSSHFHALPTSITKSGTATVDIW